MSADSWELPEELRQIQDTVARFMAAEVKPAEDRLPHDAYELPPDVLAPLQAKARDIGNAFACRLEVRIERLEEIPEPDAEKWAVSHRQKCNSDGRMETSE